MKKIIVMSLVAFFVTASTAFSMGSVDPKKMAWDASVKGIIGGIAENAGITEEKEKSDLSDGIYLVAVQKDRDAALPYLVSGTQSLNKKERRKLAAKLGELKSTIIGLKESGILQDNSNPPMEDQISEVQSILRGDLS